MKKVLLPIIILTIAALLAGCQLGQGSQPPAAPTTAAPFATLSVPPTPTPTGVAPDSRTWIAFLREDNLWLVHPDGSGLEKVTSYPPRAQPSSQHIGLMRWSPDGKSLAFTYGRKGVFSVNIYDVAASTTRVVIGETGGAFAWSPFGNHLIYNTPLFTSAIPVKDRGLWVYELDRQRKRLVLPTPDEQDALADLRWSSDGRYVLASPAAGDLSARTVIDLTNSGTVQLEAHLPPITMCDWSPSEPTLACITGASGDDPRFNSAVSFVDVNGNVLNEVPLPADWQPASAYWSPDARRLAVGYYDADSKPQTALLSVGTEVSSPLAPAAAAGWSPDSIWVLARDGQPDQEGPTQISIVSISSGILHPIAEGSDPTWQPAPRRTAAQVDTVPTEALEETLFATPVPDVALSINLTPKGTMLLVHTTSQDYELGPLEKGAFAIGPNQKFFVYGTNSGTLYAARFGQPRLDLIGKIKDFVVLNRGGEIRPAFLFFGDNPYTVQVRDMIGGEKQTFSLPRDLTADD